MSKPLPLLCILGLTLSLNATISHPPAQASTCQIADMRYVLTRRLAPTQSQELYSAQSFALKYLNPKKVKIPTTVEKTHVVKGFALIGWQQGEMAGQLLLQKRGKTWKVLTSGGGAMDLHTLTSYGVPQATAAELLQQYES